MAIGSVVFIIINVHTILEGQDVISLRVVWLPGPDKNIYSDIDVKNGKLRHSFSTDKVFW